MEPEQKPAEANAESKPEESQPVQEDPMEKMSLTLNTARDYLARRDSQTHARKRPSLTNRASNIAVIGITPAPSRRLASAAQ